MSEDREHLAYYLCFIAVVIVFSIILTTITWFCYNLLTNYLSIYPITLFESYVFVAVFLILDWAKRLIFEIFFE